MLQDWIETAHLALTPFQKGDAADVYEYWSSDPGWERHNATVPQNFTRADAKRFVTEMLSRDRANRPNWAIHYEDSVVGIVSLTFEQDHRIAVIGYGMHAKLRGQGFAVEASSSVIGHAFESYPELHRIRAHTNSENRASHRVLEKLGFSHEGTLRDNQFVKGDFQDETIFGLIRYDFESQQLAVAR